jgi:transposase
MRRVKSAAVNRLHKHDQQQLEKCLKEVVAARSYRRVKAVLLVATGVSVSKVAQVLGVSRQSVHGWLRRYVNRRAPEDLHEGPRPGRPRAARARTNARLAREFRRAPLRLGSNTTSWTVALLATHFSKRHGCHMTARTLRRRMKQRGLRGKRPRYVYAEKAPHLAQKKGLLYGSYGACPLIPACSLQRKLACASFRLCASRGRTKVSRLWGLLPVKTPSACCLASLILRPALVSSGAGISKDRKTFKPFSSGCATDTGIRPWLFCWTGLAVTRPQKVNP